jgi:hypothetical protein
MLKLSLSSKNGKVSTRNDWLRKPSKKFLKARLSCSIFNGAFVLKIWQDFRIQCLTGLSYSMFHRAFVFNVWQSFRIELTRLSYWKLDKAFVTKIDRIFVLFWQSFPFDFYTAFVPHLQECRHVEAVNMTLRQMLLARFRIEISILNYEKGSRVEREPKDKYRQSFNLFLIYFLITTRSNNNQSIYR